VATTSSPLAPLLVIPRRVAHVKRFYRENFPNVKPPRDYHRLYSNDSWAVYGGRCNFTYYTPIDPPS
jgi:hypothetical protein